LNRLRTRTATVKSAGAGCNKYTSAQTYSYGRLHHVQHKKEATEDMQRGVRMEAPILDKFCAKAGLELLQSPLIISTANPLHGATADGLGYDAENNVLYTLEAKCPRRLPTGPPLHYVIQIIQQLHIWAEVLEGLPHDTKPQLRGGYLICMTEDLEDIVCWHVSYSAEFYKWISRKEALTIAYTQNRLCVPRAVNPFTADEYQKELERLMAPRAREHFIDHPLYTPRVPIVPYVW
jgi:hypothetical protein